MDESNRKGHIMPEKDENRIRIALDLRGELADKFHAAWYALNETSRISYNAMVRMAIVEFCERQMEEEHGDE